MLTIRWRIDSHADQSQRLRGWVITDNGEPHCWQYTGEWMGQRTNKEAWARVLPLELRSYDCTLWILYVELVQITVEVTIMKLQCVRKKKTNFFVISSINLRRFWWNLAHGFLNKFAAKSYNPFPPHWNNDYTTLWSLKCSMCTCYHWVVKERKTPEFISS